MDITQRSQGMRDGTSRDELDYSAIRSSGTSVKSKSDAPIRVCIGHYFGG